MEVGKPVINPAARRRLIQGRSSEAPPPRGSWPGGKGDGVTLAKVEGITMGEVIRRAIAHYAKDQMVDPEWTVKVEALQRQLATLLPPKG